VGDVSEVIDAAVAQGGEAGVLIAGEWQPRPAAPVRNPARPQEVAGFCALGTRDDVDQAVSVAVRAQRDWGGLKAEERGTILAGVLPALDQDLDGRARLLSTEQGKTIHEARLEVGFSGAIFSGFIELAGKVDWRSRSDGPLARVEISRRQRGVVAGFVPSNWPLGVAALKLAPALLAGNAVVLKPNPSCPMAVTDMVRRLSEAIPAGLVSLVTGADEEVAMPLIDHPLVDHVSFTGSIETGSKVMARCARNVKSLTLELGGNDPAIILADAVFDGDFFDRLRTGVFATSGQVCLGVKRIYVPRPRLREFLDGFVTSCEELVMGDPLDEAVTIGPVHTAKQVERAHSMTDQARSSGATVTVVGTERRHDSEGFFVRPTIVVEPNDDADIVQEEQFAPIIPVLPYDTVDEVIDRANQTRYGLGSSLWTSDEEGAYQLLAPRLRAGTVFVNNHGIFAQVLDAPAGGVKQSGFGREFGVAGIAEYTHLQTVSNQIF
jgi:acyl-CoA reductase-like NAD-dependent aldehyde dehydrogenase